MSGSWDSTQFLVAATSSHMTRPAINDASDTQQSSLLFFSVLHTGAAPLQTAQYTWERTCPMWVKRLPRQASPHHAHTQVHLDADQAHTSRQHPQQDELRLDVVQREVRVRDGEGPRDGGVACLQIHEAQRQRGARRSDIQVDEAAF